MAKIKTRMYVEDFGENYGIQIKIKGLSAELAMEIANNVELIMNKYGKTKTIEKDSDSEEREKARSKR